MHLSAPEFSRVPSLLTKAHMVISKPSLWILRHSSPRENQSCRCTRRPRIQESRLRHQQTRCWSLHKQKIRCSLQRLPQHLRYQYRHSNLFPKLGPTGAIIFYTTKRPSAAVHIPKHVSPEGVEWIFVAARSYRKTRTRYKRRPILSSLQVSRRRVP